MKLGALFSGGKDSTLALAIAKKYHKISCLISIFSENPYSFMFHTPSISQVKKQAKIMNLPLISRKTKGKKEYELRTLRTCIKKAIKEYHIEGIVTGAVESTYQTTRIQKICNELNIECFNPLWQKDQLELLNEIIRKKFKVIIVGIAAYPLKKEWLGKKIDKKFIQEIKKLNRKYKISLAGEGGEFETFVLNCPLFKRELKIKSFIDSGKENSWKRELEVK